MMAGLTITKHLGNQIFRLVVKNYLLLLTALLVSMTFMAIFLTIRNEVVDEGTIYVAGDMHEYGSRYYPSFWKAKGEETTFLHLGGQEGGAKSATVAGKNLYVAGWSFAAARWASGQEDSFGADNLAGKFHSKRFAPTLWKHDGTITSPQLLSDLPGYANSVFALGKQVYVAGNETEESGRGFATLWKVSGEKTATVRLGSISDESRSLFLPSSEANSVYADSKNVYVAGNSYDAKGNKAATLWHINDAGTTTLYLSENRGSNAISVSVSGNSVYVFGSDFDGEKNEKVATLWQINGTNLTARRLDGINISNDDGEMNPAFILGGNVYVAGSEGGAATIWKYDGKSIAAIALGSGRPGHARSVFVSGRDLYAAGHELDENEDGQQTVPMLWQINGDNVTALALDAGRFRANGIFVK
jgi:sugar lactone lactonase YvrE